MPTPTPTPVERPDNRTLLIRFLLVLCVSGFTALGFTSIAMRGKSFPWMGIAVNLAGAAGIGLAVGYFTRILLSNRRVFVRILIGLGAVIWGLFVFGWMTYWHYGIGRLYFFRATVDWPSLALLLLGSCCALTSGLAYRKPLRTTVLHDNEATRPISRQSRHSGAIVNQQTMGINQKPARTVNKPKSTRKRGSSTAKKTTPKNKPAEGRSPGKPRSGAAVIRKRSSKKIVLAPVEQHRCPYCLEIVKRNDPRGVVECDICHTLHHADCWAITGTCQVPHYNH